MLLPLLSAILHYASLPPFSLWPLAFISLVPLFIFFEREAGFRRLFLGGLAYFGVYSMLSTIFVFDSLLLLTGNALFLAVVICTDRVVHPARRNQ